MSLEVLYVVRHGFRTNWTVNHKTGEYSSAFKSPTGIPSDPALTAHGVEQSYELATKLASINPEIEAVFSSPWYRCLQTITPFVEGAGHDETSRETRPEGQKMMLGEYGICEWYGAAPFVQPSPAEPSVMKKFFDKLDLPSLQASLVRKPLENGEYPEQLYDRVRAGLSAIVDYCDSKGYKSAVLCSHAASVIVMGRVLTGDIPEDIGREDFHAYTCGLSTYRRQKRPQTKGSREDSSTSSGDSKSLKSLPGNSLWVCEDDMDTSYLSGGAERGWLFSGDEVFEGADARKASGGTSSRL